MNTIATWTLILAFFNAPVLDKTPGFTTYEACEAVGRTAIRQCSNPRGSTFNTCWNIANFTCMKVQ